MKKTIIKKQSILGTSEKPRLVVNRSLKYISGQLIDDSQNKVILGANSRNLIKGKDSKEKASKTKLSHELGKMIAKKAKEKNISKIVFDRNGYAYHGRIKALAEGAREGGLEF